LLWGLLLLQWLLPQWLLWRRLRLLRRLQRLLLRFLPRLLR
jgi:hypothetical protein